MNYCVAGLETYTYPLVLTSSLSVRTNEICYWLALLYSEFSATKIVKSCLSVKRLSKTIIF